MIDIEISEVEKRLPRPLTMREKETAAVLLDDALLLIEDALEEKGTSAEEYIRSKITAEKLITLVAVDMVSAAILVGISRGLKSASSSTAHQADSATWDSPGDTSWGGVALTTRHLRMLGLEGAMPQWYFPPSSTVAEVIHHGEYHRENLRW